MLSQIIKEFEGQRNARGEARCWIMKCPCGEEFIKLKHNVRENTVCVKCALARKNSVPRNLYAKVLEEKIKVYETLLKRVLFVLPYKDSAGLGLDITNELNKKVKHVLINTSGMPRQSLRPDNIEVPTVDGTETPVQIGSVPSDIPGQEELREIPQGEE